MIRNPTSKSSINSMEASTKMCYCKMKRGVVATSDGRFRTSSVGHQNGSGGRSSIKNVAHLTKTTIRIRVSVLFSFVGVQSEFLNYFSSNFIGFSIL